MFAGSRTFRRTAAVPRRCGIRRRRARPAAQTDPGPPRRRQAGERDPTVGASGRGAATSLRPTTTPPRRRRPAACAHNRPKSAHRIRAQVSASASARWVVSTGTPSEVGQCRELALPYQRRQPARHRDGAERPAGRATSTARTSERLLAARACRKLALCATITRPSSRSLRAPAGSPRRRRRLVHHVLRDAGEALDPARQRSPHRARASPSDPAAPPPPTRTAPISVTSHVSPPCPLVSVSMQTNSAPATAVATGSKGGHSYARRRTGRKKPCVCAVHHRRPSLEGRTFY